jgi:hypothetical protein
MDDADRRAGYFCSDRGLVMIYTVGNREAYSKAFREQGRLAKVGKGQYQEQPYDGGGVFETESDARAHLKAENLSETHEVYGVIADWESDTKQFEGEPFRRLTRDAEMVDLKTP